MSDARSRRAIAMPSARLPSGGAWKDDPGKAEAVRTAAHLIIAAIAGPPATPPATQHDDADTALRPAERGRLLAMQLLERSGHKLPRG